MKVVDFINELKRIGFNDDTELTFSCIDGETTNWYELKPYINASTKSAFTCGEELTGEDYNNDIIDFCLDVDSCREYIDDRTYEKVYRLADEIRDAVDGVIKDFNVTILGE